MAFLDVFEHAHSNIRGTTIHRLCISSLENRKCKKQKKTYAVEMQFPDAAVRKTSHFVRAFPKLKAQGAPEHTVVIYTAGLPVQHSKRGAAEDGVRIVRLVSPACVWGRMGL